MIPKKATAILFLCFTIVVAFFNILIGKYKFCVFVIPFGLSVFTKEKTSKIFEIFGLYIIFLYFIIFQDIQFGIMGLIITSAFVFTSPLKPKTARIYTYLTTAVIAVVSYIRFNIGADRIVHAMLDAMFFIVGSGSLYCVIYRAINDAKSKDKPLEQKYLDTLEKLLKVAHETIDMLKHMQGGIK